MLGALLGLVATASAGFITWMVHRVRSDDDEDAYVRGTLHQLPTTPATELREKTYAKIVGTVVAGDDTVTAPLSGRTCVHYRVRVCEPSYEIDEAYAVTVREGAGCAFFVEDRQTRILVRSDHIRAWLRWERQRGDGIARPGDEEFWSRHGKPGAPPDVRIEEAVLRAGDRVEVAGHVFREFSGSGYRSEETRVVMTGSEQRPLLLAALR